MKHLISILMLTTSLTNMCASNNLFTNWKSISSFGVGRAHTVLNDMKEVGSVESSSIPLGIRGYIGCAEYRRFLKSVCVGFNTYYIYTKSVNDILMFAVKMHNAEKVFFPKILSIAAFASFGSYAFLYDETNEDILYSGMSSSYFSGDPGVGCLSLLFGIMHTKISGNNKVNIVSDSAFLAFGSTIYSGSSYGLYSVFLQVSMGMLLISNTALVYEGKILKIPQSRSPLYIFECAVSKYVGTGYSVRFVVRSHRYSLIWKGDADNIIDNMSHFSVCFEFIRIA